MFISVFDYILYRIYNVIKALYIIQYKTRVCFTWERIKMEVLVSDNKTSALIKIHELLDKGSFMEIGEHISARSTDFYRPDSVTESDGVVTGYGTINNSLIYIFAQDPDVMGGTFGEQHGQKIVNLYKHAIKAHAPIIGLIDCKGFRIEEGIDGLNQFAHLYSVQTEASSTIPQIMAVTGICGGGMSFSAEMADFVLIEKDKGKIFVNPQKIVENAIGNNPFVTPFDDGKYKWSELIKRIRQIIDILPPSSLCLPSIESVSEETLNRNCPDLHNMRGSAKDIITEISDDHSFIETRPNIGADIITGFIRLAGRPVGVFACNSVNGENRVTSIGCDKASRIVDICNKFNIPILSITDTDGYQTTSENEKLLPSSAGRLIRSLAYATVPKVNLVTGKIVGSIYSMMNSKGLGADYVFMWDTAEISIVNPEQATDMIFGKHHKELEQKYRESQSSALAMAHRGYTDKVISPDETRRYLIGAFETFINSR